MKYEIDKGLWTKCVICQKSLQEIKKEIGGGNIYFSKAFKMHVESHGISIEEYFFDKLSLLRKKCDCGICGKECNICIYGAKICHRKLACGRNSGIQKWSEKAKTDRLGENNPMFGKTPWNIGLTKETSEKMAQISKKGTGRKTSEESKQKQSESAKKRLIHGHTGRHHSEETKNFLRENTLRLIKEGVFKQTKSKPHMAMSKILESLRLIFEEEKRFAYFSFDFYIPKFDLYIEVDGDYFHSNPKIYPSGPKTKTQQINAANDIRKNTIMVGKNFLRFWESDILNNPEDIKCKLIEFCR